MNKRDKELAKPWKWISMESWTFNREADLLKFAELIRADECEAMTTFEMRATGDWVMKITADRRIEVNEDVDVSEAARLVLEAIQRMLDEMPAQEPVATVIEDLEHDGQGWCAKVRWLYNPVPVGETLSWEQPK